MLTLVFHDFAVQIAAAAQYKDIVKPAVGQNAGRFVRADAAVAIKDDPFVVRNGSQIIANGGQRNVHGAVNMPALKDLWHPNVDQKDVIFANVVIEGKADFAAQNLLRQRTKVVHGILGRHKPERSKSQPPPAAPRCRRFL